MEEEEEQDENDVARKIYTQDIGILYCMSTWHLYFLMLTNLLWATLMLHLAVLNT